MEFAGDFMLISRDLNGILVEMPWGVSGDFLVICSVPGDFVGT